MADKESHSVKLDEVLSVAQFMGGLPAQWWVAGGWAIDLWLWRMTREHSDLEISIWREDQLALREHWAGWEWFTPREKEWVARRDPRVRVAAAGLIVRSERWGVPVIAPEVQLLYKAKYVREKDRADYANAMERMSEGQKAWLREEVAMVHWGHEWGKFA